MIKQPPIRRNQEKDFKTRNCITSNKKEKTMSSDDVIHRTDSTICHFPLIEVQGVPLKSWTAQNWSSISEFHPDPSDLLISTYPKAGFELLKTLKPPRVIKTHLPIQLVPVGFWENKCKVIYMARNAKDNLVSYYYFDQKNKAQPEPGPWEEYIQKFMKGKLSWGSWYDHVKGYWREKKQKNILYLFFEDMKENPRPEIVRIMRYLDLSLSDDIIDKIVQLTSFKVMKENPMANYTTFHKEVLDQSISPFMRKGEVGDWTNHFTPDQSQMFDEDYKRQMADVDIPFRTSI